MLLSLLACDLDQGLNANRLGRGRGEDSGA